MKNITIIGSTGSVGTQTLDVIREYPDDFKVVGLSCYKNIEKLEKQIKEFSPYAVAVVNEESAEKLRKKVDIDVYSGPKGLKEIAKLEYSDGLVTSVVGSAGIEPTIEAIKSGKKIYLANKETLVAAGPIVMKTAKKYEVEIIPIDDELAAIHQCLRCGRKSEVEKFILTCSGGPFRGMKRKDLESVTVEEALKHPSYKMGKKTTIDSATLMNKEKPKLTDLIKLAEKIKDKNLREKTIELLKEPKLSSKWNYKASDFEKIPAWIGAHHNYEGGLIEHTLSVTELSLMVAEYLKNRYQKNINLDYIIAGALLHDIGKLFEIVEREGGYDFTNFLVDHVRLGGAELYSRGFPEEVVHIVFAHAGGDVPRTIEAKIIDFIDNLDSTIESFGKEAQQLIYLLGDSLNV